MFSVRLQSRRGGERISPETRALLREASSTAAQRRQTFHHGQITLHPSTSGKQKGTSRPSKHAHNTCKGVKEQVKGGWNGASLTCVLRW